MYVVCSCASFVNSIIMLHCMRHLLGDFVLPCDKVMNYVSGGNLYNRLKTLKKFPEEQIQFYAAEIAAALEYLHQVILPYTAYSVYCQAYKRIKRCILESVKYNAICMCCFVDLRK